VLQDLIGRAERFRWQIAGGAVLLILISIGLFWMAISGNSRPATNQPDIAVPAFVTTTESLVPRKLDGVLVPRGQEALLPRAVMVENHPDARPLSGISAASIVFEAPVEGGITRLMALYDPTSTVEEIGPVRSARPYYVEWAQGFHASYFHVGGSPDALTLLGSGLKNITNLDQFFNGPSFWRDNVRFAPHNVYTSKELMDPLVARKVATGTIAVTSWHFQDAATTTDRGDALTINVKYGGSFNVQWTFDKERGVYVRKDGGTIQKDRDGTAIEAENIVVIRTDQQILDSYGRLKVRTTGSGQAIAYRDGKKFPIRWIRASGEPIQFASTDGSEFLFTRGRTWIEVTTDDIIFGGLEKK